MKNTSKALNVSEKFKKDALNSIVAIGIMFLVGSCITVILVSNDLRSLKPKKEKIRTFNNNGVVNNNQLTRTVTLTDTKKRNTDTTLTKTVVRHNKRERSE